MFQMLNSIVRWAARVTAILLAVGFFAFALGEPMGTLRAIHFREWVGMVLLLGAIVAMLLAWKWEFPSALLSLFALAAFVAVTHMNSYGVILIAIIPDFLFLLDWKLRRLHPM